MVTVILEVRTLARSWDFFQYHVRCGKTMLKEIMVNIAVQDLTLDSL
jgi:hypothetical protein